MVLLSIFIGLPWLALAPAGGFYALSKSSGRITPAVAAVAWLLYTVYEYGMYLRYLCTGECNIRVDLVLIYPFLFLLSLMGAITGFNGLRERQHPRRRRR